ncbi:carboxylating nicotinate-nucleotide diphosphorylase [Amylibacter sp.]|jgi:nicotinate-nucleotide pyrophosphorylase (carboxylating)|nr:carboxylating nicotinate-nucleotide diphosphorylase [Amylibacter sp.]MDA9354418.1 carboxylating nicotinate-nucleotide diphosphorylase [Amylibacter sp.]MDB4184706.1 carboxylating nicotinate-nucleotide diphosphorylase [Amylibacter sp.]MDB4191195.1 carboxylating nicotinate-nucleotide diphosphorylase [Amylibacter sp.]MDB4220819.1 carboxylating nicotinate-nucleotide diphosphorylase [Amylibacter sp.]|tara:strand:+ start:246 stop:1094 length:849 start_codon:yes stop_codon:yes gene_type:complete
MDNSTIPDFFLNDIIKRALDEDLGGVGDITSRAVIPNGTKYKAKINSRSTGVISGMQIAQMAFLMIDRKLEINTLIKDGSRVSPKDTCMTIEGDAKSILMAERVALNFAGRLSAISTMTSNFVSETEGTKAKITCTRKTTPGLRLVEKEAVRHGGGSNHRYGLNDAIMIKDNHIAAAGSIKEVLERARKFASHMSAIEIEVDTLNQLEMVLSCGGANVVLLDNMTNKDMTTAVEMVDGLMLVEASGNMTLDRISSVASTGVDFISVGGLTHSVTNFDLGLDF